MTAMLGGTRGHSRASFGEVTLGKVNKPLLGAISASCEVSAHDRRARTSKGAQTHPQTTPVALEAREWVDVPAARNAAATPLDMILPDTPTPPSLRA